MHSRQGKVRSGANGQREVVWAVWEPCCLHASSILFQTVGAAPPRTPELLLADAVHQLDPGDRDPGIAELLEAKGWY